MRPKRTFCSFLKNGKERNVQNGKERGAQPYHRRVYSCAQVELSIWTLRGMFPFIITIYNKQNVLQVIAETNQGYKNSQVALKVRLHCIQQSDVADGQDSSTTLEQFTQSKVLLL